MLERGLLPDFSAAALAEVRQLEACPTAARPTAEAGARPHARLPWCSIDNDDSRDLDQLTVAERSPGGARDASAWPWPTWTRWSRRARPSTTTRGTTRPRSTPPAQIFPMLPERLSTDLTSLNPDEDRLAVVVEMDGRRRRRGARAPTSTARAVRNHAKLAYNGVAAWLEGDGPAARGHRRGRRPGRQPAPAGPGRAAPAGAAGTSTARSASRPIEARPVFDGDAHARPRRRAEEPRQGAHRGLHDRRQRRDRALPDGHGFPSIRRVVRSPEALGPDRRARRASTARRCRPSPIPRRSTQFLAERQRRRPAALPRPVAAVIKLLGAGEYVAELPGDDAARALRPGGEGLHPLHRAQPPLSRPGHPAPAKAALAGRPPPYAIDELAALAAHCTDAGGRRQQGRAAGRQVGGGAAARSRGSASSSTRIVTGASDKGTWVASAAPAGRRAAGARVRGLDVGDRVRVRLRSHRRRARLHRLPRPERHTAPARRDRRRPTPLTCR